MSIQIDIASGEGGGGGATEFVALTDTPASYSGEASKVVTVNSGETGLEFVDGVSGSFPVVVFTGTNKNLVVADDLTFFVMGSVTAQTVTVPDNATEPFPIGAEMEFLREGVGNLTFVVSGAAIIQSRDGLVTVNARYSAVTLKKIDLVEWRLIGDLA